MVVVYCVGFADAMYYLAKTINVGLYFVFYITEKGTYFDFDPMQYVLWPLKYTHYKGLDG